MRAERGTAALTAWHAQRAGAGMAQSPCTPEARAAVQKTADSAAADVARLNAELQFLRGQSKGQPAARH